MYTLELMLEQNTKLVERLDRTMNQLSQAVVDLRVQMIQGHAQLRQEIADTKSELCKEITDTKTELRQELSVSLAETRSYVDKKFFWLFTSYCGALLTLIGFLSKYFFDLYFK